jgi:hypothetical protein
MLGMNKLAILGFAALLCPILSANAQYQGAVYGVSYDHCSISKGADTMLNPWTGGLNSNTISIADLNGDGTKDFVSYDRLNNRINTFINDNTSGTGTARYIYSPQYAANFPTIRSFMLLRDYNNDNIPDLFDRGMTGLQIHRGFYQGAQLKFTFYKEVWYPGNFGPVNVYTQPNDVPGIQDADNDGDLDVLTWDIFGTSLIMHKNLRVENSLPTDSFVVNASSGCYGKVTQGFYRSFSLNASCKGFTPNSFQYPGMYDAEPTEYRDATNTNTPRRQTRHTGNSIELVDLDGDSDVDYLGGSVSYSDVQQLTWQGTQFIAQDSLWDAGTGNDILCPMWPIPHAIDLDQDGKRDLVFSQHLEQTTTQHSPNNELLFYKNVGTTSGPSYTLNTRQYLFEDMVDVGLNSYPTFFDYDKDGYKDLFVGGEGAGDWSNNSGKLSSTITYYKNISSQGVRKFQLVTNDFLNLKAKQLNGAYPHFGDVTGDGISDLIIGTNTGKIIAYQNSATSQYAQSTFAWLSDSFQNINLGEYAAPCVFDIDYDGIKDLIIGDIYGALHFYKGSYNGGTLDFAFVTDTLGGVKAGGNYYAYGYAAPYVGRIDNVNRKQLIVGTGDGTIERYDSLRSPVLGTYLKLDSVYSYIKTPIRAVAAAADIDRDGRYELVVGNHMGGLQYYKQLYLPVATGQDSVDEDTLTSLRPMLPQVYCNVYPNPSSNGTLYINTSITTNFDIAFYNTLGQKVFEQTDNTGSNVSISLPQQCKGILHYKITSKQGVASGQIIVRTQ